MAGSRSLDTTTPAACRGPLRTSPTMRGRRCPTRCVPRHGRCSSDSCGPTTGPARRSACVPARTTLHRPQPQPRRSDGWSSVASSPSATGRSRSPTRRCSGSGRDLRVGSPRTSRVGGSIIVSRPRRRSGNAAEVTTATCCAASGWPRRTSGCRPDTSLSSTTPNAASSQPPSPVPIASSRRHAEKRVTSRRRTGNSEFDWRPSLYCWRGRSAPARSPSAKPAAPTTRRKQRRQRACSPTPNAWAPSPAWSPISTCHCCSPRRRFRWPTRRRPGARCSARCSGVPRRSG